jgi:hypothetical protein
MPTTANITGATAAGQHRIVPAVPGQSIRVRSFSVRIRTVLDTGYLKANAEWTAEQHIAYGTHPFLLVWESGELFAGPSVRQVGSTPPMFGPVVGRPGEVWSVPDTPEGVFTCPVGEPLILRLSEHGSADGFVTYDLIDP